MPRFKIPFPKSNADLLQIFISVKSFDILIKSYAHIELTIEHLAFLEHFSSDF